MNNKNWKNFINKIKSQKLTDEEKNYSRLYLSKFIDNHKSRYFTFPKFNKISFFIETSKIISVSLICLLTVGVGFAQASEKALPGEILYHIKIINEEVLSLAHKGSEKKIDYEIKRTEKRIGEVAKLALADKLNSEKQVSLTKKIIEHTQKVSKEIKKLEKEKPEKVLLVQSKFESSLKINSKTLEKVKERIEENEENEIKEKIEEIPEEMRDLEIIEEEITDIEELSDETRESLDKIIAVVNIEKDIITVKKDEEIEEIIDTEKEYDEQIILIKQISEVKKNIENSIFKFNNKKEIIDEIIEELIEEEPETITIVSDEFIEEQIEDTEKPDEPLTEIIEETVEERLEIFTEESIEEIKDIAEGILDDSLLNNEMSGEETEVVYKVEETVIDLEKEIIEDEIIKEKIEENAEYNLLDNLKEINKSILNTYGEALTKEENGELGQAVALFTKVQQYLDEQLQANRVKETIKEEFPEEIINIEVEEIKSEEEIVIEEKKERIEEPIIEDKTIESVDEIIIENEDLGIIEKVEEIIVEV